MLYLQVIGLIVLPLWVGIIYWYQSNYYSKTPIDKVPRFIETFLVICTAFSLLLVFYLLKSKDVWLVTVVVGITLLAQLVGSHLIRGFVKPESK